MLILMSVLSVARKNWLLGSEIFSDKEEWEESRKPEKDKIQEVSNSIIIIIAIAEIVLTTVDTAAAVKF